MAAVPAEEPKVKKHLCWMQKGKGGVWACATCGTQTRGFNQPVEPPARGHLKVVK